MQIETSTIATVQAAIAKRIIIVKRITLTATFITAAAIGFLSLIPKLPPAIPILYIDKIEHFIAYGVLSGLAAYTFRNKRRPLLAAFIVMLICSAYGGILELLQYYTGRSRELADLIADSIGAIAGALITKGKK